mmetsp:Transcript_19510/g.36362  ORF Transcript_19510/g.36362 Transcript_19510/m.36362 type:complete len:172 (-) Transcript_19510:245-760(-)
MNMLDVLYQSPQKVITYTWLTSLVLLFVTFLVMCVAVSHMSHGHHDRVTAFAGAWSTLLFIMISVAGTYFMSHFKSTYSIGMFAGVVFIMSNQMLLVFALFVERTKDNSDGDAKSAEGAMAAFSFFMFTIYAIFGAFLVLFRDRIGTASSSAAATEEQDAHGEDVEESEQF